MSKYGIGKRRQQITVKMKNGNTYVRNAIVGSDEEPTPSSNKSSSNIEQEVSFINNELSSEQSEQQSPFSAAMINSQGNIDFSSIPKGKERTEAISEEILEGIGNLAEDEEQLAKYLDFASRNYDYSLRNQILLMIQKPEGTVFKTYKQWSAEGYQVMKGSRGADVLRPAMKNVDVLDSNGNPVMDENGKPKKEKKVVGYTTYMVFSDKDLDPSVKEPPRDPLSEHIQRYRNSDEISDNQAMREDLTSVAKNIKANIKYTSPKDDHHLKPTSGGYSTINPEGGYDIVINSDFKDHSQTLTLSHEIGHIMAGHLEGSEDRNYGNHHDRGDMEAEAETFSYMIAKMYGLDPGNKAFAYLKGWTEGDEERINKSLKASSKSFEKFCETLSGSLGIKTKKEQRQEANEKAMKKRAEKKKTTKKTTRRRKKA